MASIQYTIRGIPPELDRALRKRAKLQGKSFNAAVVESLQNSLPDTQASKDDFFDRFCGAGKDLLDDNFYEVIADFSKIDEKLWR